MRLMQGDGEDIELALFVQKMVFMGGMDVMLTGAGARQRMPRLDSGWKNHGRAVAVVHITIHGHGPCDLALLMHALDGNRDIMNHAETFAMVRKRVMESAADIAGHAVLERQVRGQNRAPGGEPECPDQFGRVWDLHLLLFLGRKRSGLQFLYVFA